MKFLAFTQASTGLPILVNIEYVTCVAKHYKSEGTVLSLATDSEDMIVIEETYDKVVARIISEEP